MLSRQKEVHSYFLYMETGEKILHTRMSKHIAPHFDFQSEVQYFLLVTNTYTVPIPLEHGSSPWVWLVVFVREL